MILLTALSPLLLVLIFLVIFRLGTSLAMALALGISSVLALIFWQMPLQQWAGALLEGVLISGTVLWIMAGAMLLLAYQRQSGQLNIIRQGFARLSPDPRLQLLWVGWFGVAFLEGIAGFGTPAAILAPLLVTLGFRPAAAVMLTLIADSAPVSFGALGTPLLIGISQGAQISDPNQLLAIAKQLVWLDALATPILPVMMLVLYCRWFAPHLPLLPALPHALVAGVAYSFSAVAWLYWLGPEFPSIMAAISGFTVSYIFQRCYPLPVALHLENSDLSNPNVDKDSPENHGAEKHNTENDNVAHTPSVVDAKALSEGTETQQHAQVTSRQSISAMAPYLAVIALLLLSRLPALPFKAWLQSFQWSFHDLLGTSISTHISPLYLPGTVFVLVVLLFVWRQSQPRQLLQVSLADCWPKLRGAALTLICAVPLVRLFVHSDINAAELPAMPVYLAALAGDTFAGSWLFFSSLLGALGAFIAGSATFSNLLFAQMQLDLALQTQVAPELMLALQMLGANAGNMICLLNLVAAASVVGLQGQERSLLKLTILPMIIYLAWATLLAVLWS